MSRKATLFLVPCLVSFLLCRAEGLADVVHRTDGSKVKGEIIKQDEDFVWVKTAGGTVKVPAGEVERIERAGENGETGEGPGIRGRDSGKQGEGEKAGAGKPAKDATSPAEDRPLGGENLEKLLKIREERAAAYEGVPWENAFKYNTPHFDITCNSTKKYADHYAKLMEKLYEKFREVFEAFSPRNVRCRIEIYRNYTEFRRVKGIPPGVAGFYSPGRHILCAFRGRMGAMGAMTTEAVLAHEGCHLFQDLFLPSYGNAPLWLLEGMAVLMEAAKIEKDGKIHIRGVSPARLALLQSMIKGGAAIPLSKVMAAPQAQFRAEYYAHAGMFTFWLIKGSRKNDLALLYNDYLRIAAGGPGQQPRKINPGDFENVCSGHGVTLSKLEEEWRKWVLKQEVERPGKVAAGKFICNAEGFEVSSPGPGWKLDVDNVFGSEFCVMTGKNVKGRISISVGGTFGTPNLAEYLPLAEEISRQSRSKWQNFREISREFKKYLGGLDGYEIVHEYADPESPVTKEFQKRRVVAISLVDTLYIIGCMADPGGFDSLQEHYDRVVASFRLDANKLD